MDQRGRSGSHTASNRPVNAEADNEALTHFNLFSMDIYTAYTLAVEISQKHLKQTIISPSLHLILSIPPLHKLLP